jgi:hypothetical protein
MKGASLLLLPGWGAAEGSSGHSAPLLYLREQDQDEGLP